MAPWWNPKVSPQASTLWADHGTKPQSHLKFIVSFQEYIIWESNPNSFPQTSVCCQLNFDMRIYTQYIIYRIKNCILKCPSLFPNKSLIVMSLSSSLSSSSMPTAMKHFSWSQLTHLVAASRCLISSYPTFSPPP